MKTWSDKITRWIGSPASIVVHTLFFIGAFAMPFFGASLDRVLLVLTTVVSLEAIYLALFIQMTVNRNTESLEDIEEDVEEMQEDIEDVQEDIGEISEDIEEVQEDLDEIQEDEEDVHDARIDTTLGDIQKNLGRIMEEIETLKRK
jgi:low affinity Fe/Cu permease